MSIVANQNEQIKKLNTLLEKWCEQFENKPEPSFAFSLTNLNMVQIAGTVLAPIDDIDFESAEVDVFGIYFCTKEYEFEIHIHWAADHDPVISHIIRSEVLYSND